MVVPVVPSEGVLRGEAAAATPAREAELLKVLPLVAEQVVPA